MRVGCDYTGGKSSSGGGSSAATARVGRSDPGPSAPYTALPDRSRVAEESWATTRHEQTTPAVFSTREEEGAARTRVAARVVAPAARRASRGRSGALGRPRRRPPARARSHAIVLMYDLNVFEAQSMPKMSPSAFVIELQVV